MRSGTPTFSRAVSSGISPKLWKMKPSLVSRSWSRSLSSIWPRLRPNTRTSPRVGVSSPAIRLSSVVLPEPDRPTIAVIWCGHTSSVTSLTAWMSSPARW